MYFYIYYQLLQSKKKDLEEEVVSRKKSDNLKLTTKEQLAVKGFMKLIEELHNKGIESKYFRI